MTTNIDFSKSRTELFLDFMATLESAELRSLAGISGATIVTCPSLVGKIQRFERETDVKITDRRGSLEATYHDIAVAGVAVDEATSTAYFDRNAAEIASKPVADKPLRKAPRRAR